MKPAYVLINPSIDYPLCINADSPAEAKTEGIKLYGNVATNATVRLYATSEFVRAKYPNLIRKCKQVAILTEMEAAGCIRDFLNGYLYSGEAVNHYGGTSAVIQQAIRLRNL